MTRMAAPQHDERRPLAIRATGLVKRYPHMRRAALDNLDFSVGSGEMVAVTGPSGSGKSTLLYALSGLIGLDRGSVSLHDTVPGGRSDWTAMRAGPLGLVFQDPWLLPTLSAAQNVELPMIGVERAAGLRADRVGAVLDLVGLSDKAGRDPASLSGGERQRVAIARALVNRPRIILADEPTGELDSTSSDRIIALFADLVKSQGVTLVIVTHDRDIARRCGREFRIVDGQGAFLDSAGGVA